MSTLRPQQPEARGPGGPGKKNLPGGDSRDWDPESSPTASLGVSVAP